MRYRLRSLLILTTAIAVLLAMARAYGWLLVYVIAAIPIELLDIRPDIFALCSFACALATVPLVKWLLWSPAE
jgi:hypothetical protein